MTKCKKYRELMADELAGDISAADRERLQAHLRDCCACAGEYDGLQGLIGQVKDLRRPEPDEEYWTAYMRRLDDKLAAAGQADSTIVPLRLPWRRLLMPVAAAALLVIGVLIGRSGIFSPVERPEPPLLSAAAPSKGNPRILQTHLSRIEPLLVDLNNQDSGDGQPVRIDERFVRDLLMQNYMLKRAIARQNEPVQKKLLDDLEMILLEMQAGTDGGAAELSDARRISESNDVLFQLRLLRKRSERL